MMKLCITTMMFLPAVMAITVTFNDGKGPTTLTDYLEGKLCQTGNLISVDEWDDAPIGKDFFKDCISDFTLPSDPPVLDSNVNFMFFNTTFNGRLDNWDVSGVTSMISMFEKSRFNNGYPAAVYSGDGINRWNVSGVETIYNMFRNSTFNGDISGWKPSSVIFDNYTGFYGMFLSSPFNGDLSGWDIQGKSVSVFDSAVFRCIGINNEVKAKFELTIEQCNINIPTKLIDKVLADAKTCIDVSNSIIEVEATIAQCLIDFEVCSNANITSFIDDLKANHTIKMDELNDVLSNYKIEYDILKEMDDMYLNEVNTLKFEFATLNSKLDGMKDQIESVNFEKMVVVVIGVIVALSPHVIGTEGYEMYYIGIAIMAVLIAYFMMRRKK